MKALKEIEKDKLRVARAHNKKVKSKSFWRASLEDDIASSNESNKFGNGRQVGRVRIKLLKLSLGILIRWRRCKEIVYPKLSMEDT